VAARAKADKNLRGWKWAAAAAAFEAAETGAGAISDRAVGSPGRSVEAEIARAYLKRVEGTYAAPRKATFRALAQALWDDLGADPLEEWVEGGRYNLSPYHLRIVQDKEHDLYDVRGHEETDPNPKEFCALVEAIAAVGWVMQAVIFTEERGLALIVEGRRRVRASRAVNLRRLSAAEFTTTNPQAAPPMLIESIAATCVRDRTKLLQVKNGSNYHRCAEDALRQLAGIQQLEKTMSLVAIAAMLGVTTQTLANQRSLAGLSPTAREALRTGQISLTLAYRLARELPARQDGALEATKDLPAKSRQRAVDAWLAGDSPEAEARALRARDVRSLGKRVAENRDPELAPLRALFAVLRGHEASIAELPAKWRECLGLSDEAASAADAAGGEDVGDVQALPSKRREQLVIDDGVPYGMRVRCAQCEAEPTEYCIGDGPDEEEKWGFEDNTRIHQSRIVAAKRARMPDLPVIAGPSAVEVAKPALKRGRKGDRKGAEPGTASESGWHFIRYPVCVPVLEEAGIRPEECLLGGHLVEKRVAERGLECAHALSLADLLNDGCLTVAELTAWVQRMRDAASTVVCTTCGSDVGHDCVHYTTGDKRPHVARMKLAERAREIREVA